MREALRGLTTRGRCFLSAGIAAGLSAVLLGQDDLFRVAILVVALPLVSAAVVSRTRYRLASQRHLEPARVPVGQEARVYIELQNVSRLPTGLMLVEDRLPYVLGVRPRFVLDRVPPRGRRRLSYTVRSEARGRYSLGPLTLRLSDPFGMCELVRAFQATDVLLVTPAVVRLPSTPLGGEWAGAGESRTRSVATAGEDDVATREYRQGDELRRVHWRSTARRGELMVRREEQPWESHCTVVLDTRWDAHRGEGPASSFEWAVSAAASVALHAARSGYVVALQAVDGRMLTVPGDIEGSQAVIDALAVVQADAAGAIPPGVRVLAPDGLLVAVLGRLSTDDAETLLRAHRRASSAVAVVLDVETWRAGDAGGDTGPAALLQAAGWRVVVARAGDDLAALWPQVARGSRVGVGR
ncbi:MAG TPA: DUF58 domain-containing protein [Actinomycetes bacterium]|nr:DUF58 domain-containing protein [Actinomycetes bacterium]